MTGEPNSTIKTRAKEPEHGQGSELDDCNA